MTEDPPSFRKLRAALGVAFLTTAALGSFGCASQPAKLPPPAPVQTVACLPLKIYTPAEQKALAAQLATIPADSPVASAFVDYERMRDSDRAACPTK